MTKEERLECEIARLRAELSLMIQEKGLQEAYIGMLERRNCELERECMELKVRLGEAGNA